MVRSRINLGSALLDTPEFFWDRSAFEPIYADAYDYFDLGKRMVFLNEELDIVHELLSMLNGHLDYVESNRLEWIVTILVALCVIQALVWNIIIKDCLGMFPDVTVHECIEDFPINCHS